MKTINKIAFFIVTCLTLSNVPTYGFYYGDDPGANFVGNAGTATLFTGAATGNRTALGVGAGLMATGAIMNASRRNKRRREYDDRGNRYDDYNDGYGDYRSNKRRRYDDSYYGSSNSSKKRQRRLEDENAELRRRLQEYEN